MTIFSSIQLLFLITLSRHLKRLLTLFCVCVCVCVCVFPFSLSLTYSFSLYLSLIQTHTHSFTPILSLMDSPSLSTSNSSSFAGSRTQQRSSIHHRQAEDTSKDAHRIADVAPYLSPSIAFSSSIHQTLRYKIVIQYQKRRYRSCLLLYVSFSSIL